MFEAEEADKAPKPFRRIRKLPRLFSERAWRNMWAGGRDLVDGERVCAGQNEEDAKCKYRFVAGTRFPMQKLVLEFVLVANAIW